MTSPVILFFGYGSEYSLHPLCEFMSSRGDNCVEIDMLTDEDCVGKLQSLFGKPLLFVTSAHPLCDAQNFFYYRTERRIISALHVISTLRPKLSVYYPHDYKDPVKEEEVHYLTQFDLLLWPFKDVPARYRRLVHTIPVGWIKNPVGSNVQVGSVNGRAIFFLGAYQYYLHSGLECFEADFGAMLGSDIGIKLPRWHENGRFEEFLRERKVDVYSSEENSVDLIKSCDVVLTHALSSVGLEACHLGKRVIYILDARFDYKDPIREFRGAGKIAFADSPSTAAQMRRLDLPVNEHTMAEFDFDYVRDLILKEFEERADR